MANAGGVEQPAGARYLGAEAAISSHSGNAQSTPGYAKFTVASPRFLNEKLRHHFQRDITLWRYLRGADWIPG
jgi:hypothetical protein